MSLVRNWPTLSIQVAFGTDANSASSPVWTDISSRVLNVDLERSGRTTEQDYFQNGTATLTLDNSDGAFSPVNTTSPYYPNLLPYRPIRIQATWNGITYPLWQGYVERWPQTWVDPMQGRAPVECVDAFALITQIGLDSAVQAEALLANALVYYPMGEASGSSTAGNASGSAFPPGQIFHTKTVNATTPASYQFGQPLDLPGAAVQTGLQFTGTNFGNNPSPSSEDGYALVLQQIPFDWTNGWMLQLWVQIPKWNAASSGHQMTILRVVDPSNPTSTDSSLVVQIDCLTHDLLISIVDPAGNAYNATPPPIDDGKPHLLSFWYYPGSGGGFLIDDNLLTEGAWPSTLIGTGFVTSTVMIGADLANAQLIPLSNPTVDGNPLTGTVGHFAVFPLPVAPVSAAQNNYQTGVDAFAGETSDARAIRLLNYGGLQPSAQNVQAGESTMAPASSIAGTSLLQALQTVSDAEQGTLSVTSTGLVDFRSRTDRILKTGPSITFGSLQASGEIPYLVDQLQFDFDPILVVNDWQISRPSGITAEAADDTSIAHYYPRTKQLTMQVDSDEQVQNAADWSLDREAEPHLRLEEITIDAGTVDGTAFTAFWPAMLGLDLHARALLNHRPMGAPQISFAGFVEKLHHTIDPSETGGWKIAVQMSPVMADYWILEDPVQGFIDSTFVVAF